MMKTQTFLTTILAILTLTAAAQAQTSGFSYQGRFSDANQPQPTNGVYEMEFALFDALSGGLQIGAEIDNPSVSVINGIFSVQLDFGAAAFADGEARFLQISARRNATEACITLSPRQPISSVPYSVRSQSAANAAQLGGVNANQFIQEGDTRLTDSRPANSVNFSTAQVSGVVPVANGGTGSATQTFVDLTTTQTIAGNKTFSGTLSGNTVNSATQFNIGGNRVLSIGGDSRLSVGVGAGQNSTAFSGIFIGANAGRDNTNAAFNTFVGTRAGINSTGGSNSFFGSDTGFFNVDGNNNTLIGDLAGVGSGNLSFATAIGSNAFVSTSNTIQLGRVDGSDQVLAPGGIALRDSGIRLREAADTNHSIGYGSSFNGILSRSFAFRWQRFTDNVTLMDLASNGDLRIFGSYGQLSDARYKTNVQTFGNALDILRRLRGVTFNWKPEHNDNQQTQIGFIAQEVEAVLPELVSTDKEGYKSVAYSNAVPVLVEAIKEQQKQIEEQRLLIDGLRKLVCQNNPTAAVCQ